MADTPTPDESVNKGEQTSAVPESSAQAASPSLADQIREDDSEKKLHRLFFFTMGAGAAALATAGAFHAFSGDDDDNADVAAPETSVTESAQPQQNNKTTVTETTTVTPFSHPDAPGASSQRSGEPQGSGASDNAHGNGAYGGGMNNNTGGAGMTAPGYSSDSSSAATPERGSAQSTSVYGAPQVGGVYIIAPGDTLSGISATTNITIDALVRANGIADPNLIYAYAPLQIPGREGF